MNGGGTVTCTYAEFPDHFGFFMPLAGITTVNEIRESSFDVKATGRLNKLYVQLLKENPDWASVERQHDMNHFMARPTNSALTPLASCRIRSSDSLNVGSFVACRPPRCVSR